MKAKKGYCPVCRNHKIVLRQMCRPCEARGGKPFDLGKYLAGGETDLFTVKRSAEFMCIECRRVHVSEAQQLCGKCGHKSDLRRRRENYRGERELDSPFFENSPLQAEALTHADL